MVRPHAISGTPLPRTGPSSAICAVASRAKHTACGGVLAAVVVAVHPAVARTVSRSGPANGGSEFSAGDSPGALYFGSVVDIFKQPTTRFTPLTLASSVTASASVGVKPHQVDAALQNAGFPGRVESSILTHFSANTRQVGVGASLQVDSAPTATSTARTLDTGHLLAERLDDFEVFRLTGQQHCRLNTPMPIFACFFRASSAA